MKLIQDVLYHYYEKKSSKRRVPTVLASGTAHNHLRRATDANLFWPLPEEITDQALEVFLFPSDEGVRRSSCSDVHKQLSRSEMIIS